MTMLLIPFFLAALCDLQAIVVADDKLTPCVKWTDGQMYREDVLMTDLDHPSRLTVDHATNTLYFNQYYREIKAYKCAKFNLDTKTYGVIEELVGTCWITVDQSSGKKYAGCRNDAGRGGLFEYDPNICQFKLIAEEGKDIEFVYFSDVLFYAIHPVGTVHAYVDGRGQRLSDIDATGVKQLVIENEDIVFYNVTGLYRKEPIFAIVQTDNTTIIAVTVDAKGKFWYADNSTSHLGLTSDKDNNLIFADWTSSDSYYIYRRFRCD